MGGGASKQYPPEPAKKKEGEIVPAQAPDDSELTARDALDVSEVLDRSNSPVRVRFDSSQEVKDMESSRGSIRKPTGGLSPEQKALAAAATAELGHSVTFDLQDSKDPLESRPSLRWTPTGALSPEQKTLSSSEPVVQFNISEGVRFEEPMARAESTTSSRGKRKLTGFAASAELRMYDVEDEEEEGGEVAEGYGASHTSFYTDAVAKDHYDPLGVALRAHLADSKLRSLVGELLGVCGRIAEALRVNLVTVNDSSNAFGDTQLTVDIIADKLLWDWAKSSHLVCEASSEEEPEIVKTSADGQFVLCWDPLDGSSIVDNNWAVGTIVGVWDRSTGLLGATGRDQVMSLVVLYGPRTTAFVSLDDGVYEFTFGSGNRWICSRERIQIRPECKIFSPANLRAAQEVEGYAKLMEHYMKNKYTLRYSGGLVPDVCQLFTKCQGVFTNPTSKASPAKLRLAFEAAPFARLVELAGGKTSDGVTGGSTLDIRITAVDQRCPLALGSVSEVERFNELVLNSGVTGA